MLSAPSCLRPPPPYFPQVYYFNTLTNESSWTKPEGFSGEVSNLNDTPVSVPRASGTYTALFSFSCQSKSLHASEGMEVHQGE
jgi:hypothetical protein